VSGAALKDALALIRQSPRSSGVVEMIVRRPTVNEREVLQQGELSADLGLLGDNWATSWPARQERHPRHCEMQINLMNSRVIDAICAGDRQRWPLAGDQLFVDFDLSEDNLPAGTKIQVGEAVLEVTSEPHLGCRKFERRFGRDAVLFVNSDTGKSLKLRGINARVLNPGVVITGAVISKLAPF
jgi:hypothetical protein